MARRLQVEIVGDASSLHRAYGKASKSGSSFGRALGGLAKGAAIAAGAAGIGGLFLTLRAGIGEFAQAAKVSAQTGAVLKSTGGAAKVSAQQVSDLAGALMRKSGVDDEAIQSGENMLLTFTKIRNEAGRGNDIFTQATKATLDLSVAMGKDMPASAILVGKALNDPIKGMTALSKAGIQFTDAQKDSIKAMVESGNTMGAQKAILKELNTQFGGSAEAVGKTLPGQINILRETFNNLAGDLVGSLAPAFTTALGAVSDFVARLSAAKGLKAKLSVVWEGARGMGAKLVRAVRDAIDRVDWTMLGTRIMDGIASAIEDAGNVAKATAEAITAAIGRINWEQVGKVVGPGLATAIVVAFTTLTDIGFWVRNWDLAFAVALVAASGPIGRVAGKLGSLLKAMLGKAVGNAVLSIASHMGKLGPLFLAGFLAAERIATAAVAKLGGVVARAAATVAGKIGKALTFVVKVIGVQAAINAAVQLGQKIAAGVKKGAAALAALGAFLVGKVVSAIGSVLSVAYSMATGIGSAIVNGIRDAISSAWGALKGWFSDRVGDLLDVDIPGLSPPRHAAMEAIGKPIMLGIADGIQRNADKPRTALQASLAAVMAFQSQLDRINARRAAQDRALAVSDAQRALAEARKKNEGITAAERALARARQDIVVAGIERRLAAEQASVERSRAIIAKVRENLGGAFDAMADRITRAFDRITGAFVAPAEGELGMIQARRQAEDQAEAVADAERALADVRANPEATANEIADAERALARAREDITVTSLEKTATAQRTAWEQERADMRERLDDRLAQLRNSFEREGATIGGATGRIAAALAEFGVDFANVGSLLGDQFLAGLRDSISDVTITAGQVLAKLSVPVKKKTKGTAPRAHAFAHGGIVTRPTLGLIGEAGPEAVIPLPRSGAGRSAAAPVINLTVNGWVGDDRALVERLRAELIRGGRRMPGVLGGLA